MAYGPADDGSPLVGSGNVPDHTLDNPAVLEPTELGLLAPELAEAARTLDIVGRRAVVDEAKSLSGVENDAELDDLRKLRGWLRTRQSPVERRCRSLLDDDDSRAGVERAADDGRDRVDEMLEPRGLIETSERRLKSGLRGGKVNTAENKGKSER